MKTTIKSTPIMGLAIAATFTLLAEHGRADTATFQEGVSGYTGVEMQEIRSNSTGAPANQNTVFNSPNVIMGKTQGAAGTAAFLIRGICSFDLSLIPTGSTINSVKLDLWHVTDGGASLGGAVQFNLHALNMAFTPNATWNNSTGDTIGAGDDWAGGAFDPTILQSLVADPEATPDGAVQFGTSANFVAAVQSALDGSGTFDFLMKLDNEADINRHVYVMAGESTLPTFSPILTIDYSPVPEPSSCALMAMGIVTLVARGKFRSSKKA